MPAARLHSLSPSAIAALPGVNELTTGIAAPYARERKLVSSPAANYTHSGASFAITTSVLSDVSDTAPGCAKRGIPAARNVAAIATQGSFIFIMARIIPYLPVGW